jgi:ribonuclease T
MPSRDVYISVDVETAGPTPDRYAMLSIGACTMQEPRQTFYVELQPDRGEARPEALAVSGLELQQLRERGETPAEAMAHFAAWVDSVTPAGGRPVFVAFNAPFDWSFVNCYFHRYLDRNPFGHAALDIKALYMGANGVPWSETAMRHVAARYLDDRVLTHHALQDALDQADIFNEIGIESGFIQEA